MKARRVLLVLTYVSLSFPLSLVGQDTHKNSGFLDFNGYYDTREHSTLTINLLANLNHRFQYFSLTNYDGAEAGADIAGFYAEHNLRWAIQEGSPLDLTYQHILRQGIKNDAPRLGFRLSIHKISGLSSLFQKLNLRYSFNPMLVETFGYEELRLLTAIEHVYSIVLFKEALDGKLKLGGFADQNFFYTDEGFNTEWVTEHQLSYELLKQFYAVVEYRINTFLEESQGIGYGLEYKITF